MITLLTLTACGGATTGSSDLSDDTQSETETSSQALEMSNLVDSRFGYNHINRTSYELSGEIGGGWVRPNLGVFNWGQIETSAGEYNWENQDMIVQMAQAQDFNIMITIFPFADWDQSTCRDELSSETQETFTRLGAYRQNPCDMDAYRRFVASLVERYDGDGVDDMEGLLYPIRHWEIANEPAIAQSGEDISFYSGSTSDYVELLTVSNAVIRENDENAQIMHAGLFGILEDATDYWDQVFSSEAGRDFEIANYHSISSNSEDGQMGDAATFFSGNSIDNDVWVTEFEFAESTWNIQDDSDAALTLVQVYTRTFASGASKVFIAGPNYDLSTSDETQNAFAIIDSDGEITETGIAYKTLIAHIDYFTNVSVVSDGVYKFVVGGQDVYVLWDVTYDIESLGQVESLTDLAGTSYDTVEELGQSNPELVFVKIVAE